MKTALVAGASIGFGFGVALELAQRGWPFSPGSCVKAQRAAFSKRERSTQTIGRSRGA